MAEKPPPTGQELPTPFRLEEDFLTRCIMAEMILMDLSDGTPAHKAAWFAGCTVEDVDPLLGNADIKANLTAHATSEKLLSLALALPDRPNSPRTVAPSMASGGMVIPFPNDQ